MADDTDISALKDKFDALTKQVTQMNKLFGKFNSSSSSSGSGAIKQSTKDLGDLSKKTKTLESGFEITASKTNTLIKSLSQGAIDIKGFVAGYSAVYKTASAKFGAGAGLLASSLAIGVDAISHEFKDIVKQYQDMRDIGQTYGGSIIGLGEAAAASRMSLDEYSKFMTKNSQAASVVPIAAWSAGLRSSLRDVGELGMSTSEANDVVGSFASIMGMAGKLSQISNNEAVASTRDLSIEITALAGVSGKSRMAILQDTQAAMNTATLRATIAEKEGQAGVNYANNITKATAFLSSIPGEGGQFFSKMLAETAGAGASFLTQSGQTMIKAGMFGVNDIMDKLNAKLASGQQLSAQEEANAYQEILKEGQANMEGLRMQALGGNAEAAKTIEIITDMQNNATNFTAANIEKQNELAQKQKAGTQALSNLEDTFNAVGSTIRDGFWKALEAFTSSKAYDTFVDKLKGLGDQISAWFNKFFTPQNIDALLDTIQTIGSAVWTFGQGVIEGFKDLIAITNAVSAIFKKVHDALGTVGTVLAALAVVKFAKNVKQAGVIAKNKAALAEQAVAVGDGVSKALSRFAMGSALRVYESNAKAGGGGGGNFPDEHNRKETPEERNRRIRKGGKLGGAVGEAETIAEDVGHSPLAKDAEKVIAKEATPGHLKSLLGVGEKLVGHAKSMMSLGGVAALGGGLLLDHYKDKLPGSTGLYANAALSKAGEYSTVGTGIGAVAGGVIGGVLGFGGGAVPGAMAGAEIGGTISSGIGAVVGVVEEYMNLHKKPVAPKTPGPSSISKTDPASPQSVAANLQKQNADLQKSNQVQQAVLSKILDSLNHGNAQDRAIANQSQDNMKKLGVALNPNKV